MKELKKWTYETCWQVANGFTTLKDFRIKYSSAYNVASRNGWIKEYTWLKVCKNHGYWDYDKCYKEAKKYITITDFAKECGSAHFRAKENGWIKDYTWFVDGRQLSAQKRTKWDYNACYELAKQCVKKTEMHDKNIRAYEVALKNGWFTEYTWFLDEETIRHQKRPSRVKWPYEKCKELALQYSTLAEFHKAYPSVYTVSKRNGWIDDFDWLGRSCNIYTSKIDNVYAYFFNEFNSVYVGRTVEPSKRDIEHNANEKSTVFRFASENNTAIPKMMVLESGLTIMEGLDREDYYCNKYRSEGWNVLNIAKTGRKSGSLGSLGSGKWNYKSCYKEAQKYRTLKEFRKKSPSAYNVACKNGWQELYYWLTIKSHKCGYWTYERCYEEAKKYETRKQFQVGSGSAYDKSLKEKWLDDYIWFKPSVTGFRWNYENCFNEAKKYKTLKEFREKCGRTYYVARKNKWVKDYTWLIKKDISQKVVLQFSLDGEFIAKYSGVREVCRLNGFNNGAVSLCCCGKLKKHKGFRWMYADDFLNSLPII